MNGKRDPMGSSAAILPHKTSLAQVRTLRRVIAGEIEAARAARHTRRALERRGLLAGQHATAAGVALLARWDRI